MRACGMGILVLALAVPATAGATPRRAEDPPTLYFFFSPRAPSGAEAARRAALFLQANAGKIRFRPVLLVDEEGLRLAVSWELRSVPAFVLVRQDRAHRTLGPQADLGALLGCRP